MKPLKGMLMRGIVLGTLFFVVPALAGADPTDATTLASFGTSGKELHVLGGGVEAELFTHVGKGCLTHMWFGGDWPGYDRTRLRIYIDGETTPSIDMEMFLGHGIGFGDDAAPWGTHRFGKTGHPSGVFNNYLIPFGKSIRVTAQLGNGVKENPPFWWIIRGVENLPVEFNGVRLPENARLKLYTIENRDLDPLEYIDIASVQGGGMLYQVTMSIRSDNLNFLEAMIRAWIDGAEEPLYLSSGTEDYFLGTYYFNRGKYHLPEAGVTHLEHRDGQHQFSAYRFHEQDPIFFKDGFRLAWRNGETTPEEKPYGSPRESNFFSYVWVYQW